MGMMFSNLTDACTWLYVQGWRQDNDGHWLKGKKEADVRRSPASDGVVCVIFRRHSVS